MRLKVMGAGFPTRLSFLRRLIRALHDNHSAVTRPVWEIDEDGYGQAVYCVDLGGYTYSLVAMTRDLPEDMRTDRVIATAWDAAFVLYDGVPDKAERARIAQNAPLQEAGRFTEKDLVLSRANKSVRLFAEVSAALRGGTQPDPTRIREIGYLMRTTAVYGNGKFGMADRDVIADRPVLDGPFAAEMLTVWLIRGFTHDLIEHVGGHRLDRELKRHLGIGNSTGLGMAPFLVSHPILMNNWVMARETALARCLSIGSVSEAKRKRLCDLAIRVGLHLAEWVVPDETYTSRIKGLQQVWPDFVDFLSNAAELTFERIMDWPNRHAKSAEELTELVVALILEANPEVVDGLADCMNSNIEPRLEPGMTCADLAAAIEEVCAWALEPDFECKHDTAQFWYVSEAKLEPRLGLRHEEDGSDLESPLDIARRIQALFKALPRSHMSVAEFLLTNPNHRFAVQRVQNAMRFPYAEINDNLIGRDCLAIDMLRFKLAMFGASKFDPKSDRWTRITLAQGAPLFDEIQDPEADDWWLPVFGQ